MFRILKPNTPQLVLFRVSSVDNQRRTLKELGSISWFLEIPKSDPELPPPLRRGKSRLNGEVDVWCEQDSRTVRRTPKTVLLSVSP